MDDQLQGLDRQTLQEIKRAAYEAKVDEMEASRLRGDRERAYHRSQPIYDPVED